MACDLYLTLMQFVANYDTHFLQQDWTIHSLLLASKYSSVLKGLNDYDILSIILLLYEKDFQIYRQVLSNQ